MWTDNIEAYKHYHTYDKSTLSKSFTQNVRPSRKHAYQLYQRRAVDGTRGMQSNSFYFRTTKTWNDLPAEVVDAPTLNAFKNRLDRFWMNHELKYDYKVSIKIDL